MSETNENILMPVSIQLLYDGMIVSDDIYDSSRERLLIKSGNTLSDIQIERIKSLNENLDTIYVTGRTHQSMVSRRPNAEIVSMREIEDSTGYTKVKNETFKLLGELAKNRTVSMDSMQIISDDLSTRLESTPPAIIVSLINAMAPVDEYLQRHSVNVGFLNGLIGRWIGLSDIEIDQLVLIGLMHDCGKTLLPPKVLNAARKLTVIEYEVVKKHAEYTYELLFEFPEPVRLASSGHHERLNGTGYPNKLLSDDVSLAARITAISDTYDAMVARRAYQGPQSPFRVMARLDYLSRHGLDSDVIRIFKENMPKELIDKPIQMSDGTIGIVREYDPDDIEFPKIEISERIVKSNHDLYCVSMYHDE